MMKPCQNLRGTDGKTSVLIMGAAGRDFHNFNVYFRENPAYRVVAFTATQIPNIECRTYPPELSGALYPDGIPIYPESDLETLIGRESIDQVVFAYSDVPHEYVMHKASAVLAAGADFRLMGARSTMLRAAVPVISICAARTGSGKSQTTRRVSDILRAAGKRVVAVRHPMPYGDLAQQACQRFATYADLDLQHCTIEEREEYEPHIDRGVIVYAGVDYCLILHEAEKEADVILWDGGNNDLPFYAPDLHIVVVDPHRAGHELTYHPGEANVRMADVVVINKVDTADLSAIVRVRANVRSVNPRATIIEAASPIFVDHPEAIAGKRVLVIEDGPTLTHGEMAYGAGVVAARRFGASEIIDPRPYAVGSILETYTKYPKTGALLPAMGYSAQQICELEETIRATPADLVIIGTPIDLRRIVEIRQPTERVRYELQEIGKPDLEQVLRPFLGEVSAMPTDKSRPATRKWRPAPAALVEAFQHALASLPAAEPRRMFGYPCAFVNGQMFAGVHQESLMIRLSEADRRELLSREGAHLFEPMEGRPMREYVVVPPAIMDSDAELHEWLERALRYASSLPPKPAKRRRDKA